MKKTNLKYSSSDKKIYTVTRGKITAKKMAGTSTVTIYDKISGVSISFVVTVE